MCGLAPRTVLMMISLLWVTMCGTSQPAVSYIVQWKKWKRRLCLCGLVTGARCLSPVPGLCWIIWRLFNVIDTELRVGPLFSPSLSVSLLLGGISLWVSPPYGWRCMSRKYKTVQGEKKSWQAAAARNERKWTQKIWEFGQTGLAWNRFLKNDFTFLEYACFVQLTFHH